MRLNNWILLLAFVFVAGDAWAEKFVLKSGDVVEGLVKYEDKDYITVRLPTEEDTVVFKADLKERSEPKTAKTSASSKPQKLQKSVVTPKSVESEKSVQPASIQKPVAVIEVEGALNVAKIKPTQDRTDLPPNPDAAPSNETDSSEAIKSEAEKAEEAEAIIDAAANFDEDFAKFKESDSLTERMALARGMALKTSTRANLKAIQTALAVYEVENMQFPSTDEGIGVLYEQGFLEKPIRKDAWGNDFIYRFPGANGGRYDLYSKGPNGKDDGMNGDDVVLKVL